MDNQAADDRTHSAFIIQNQPCSRRLVRIDVDRQVHTFLLLESPGRVDAVEERLCSAAAAGFDQGVPAVLVFEKRHRRGIGAEDHAALSDARQQLVDFAREHVAALAQAERCATAARPRCSSWP